MPTFRKTIFDETLWLDWWQSGTRYSRKVSISLPPGCRVISSRLVGYVTCYIYMTCMAVRWEGEKVYETCWGWGESGKREIDTYVDVPGSGTYTVDIDLWKQIWFPRAVDYYVHLELVIEYEGVPPITQTEKELKRMLLTAAAILTIAVPVGIITAAIIKKKRGEKK